MTISFDEAHKIALRCNSYTRLPTIIDLAHRMEREAWLALLGDGWSTCDNISEWRRAFLPLLPRVGPVPPMMNTREHAAWHALPEKITIYRGARKWPLGVSWTLDRSIAERFPFFLRYMPGGDPILLTATVRKRDVLALKFCRNEVIVPRNRRNVSREPITEPEWLETTVGDFHSGVKVPVGGKL